MRLFTVYYPTTVDIIGWAIIYESKPPAFCEYGGTQTRPEYDVKPVDMPPMGYGTVGGIRPCLTQA